MSARYPLEGSSAGDLSMQLDSSPPFFSPPDLKEMSNNLNAEPPNTSSSSSSSAAASTAARKPKPNLTIKPSAVRFSGRNAFRVWTDSDKQRRANRKATQSVNTKPQLLAKFSCVHLVEFYQRCHSGFKYQPSTNPRRVLTKPSERVGNNGYDNVNSNLIMCVNDLLFAETNSQGRTFRVLESLGQGTFGQVVSCENVDTKQKVAIKVIKNKPAYFNQALMEIRILKNLNRDVDPDGNRHLLRLLDYFVHRNHLCLVFELLSVNLYELVKTYHFRGLSCNLIRYFGDQMLDALSCLRKAKIIHCDLKPENVLLEKLSSPKIKLVDFGSACYEGQTVYCYIQSRFYRSPEVLLGLPYDSAIDMWSLGCIMAELFLGLPLYPGTSQYNQIYRIVKMQGSPPTHMLARASKTSLYFNYCEGAETPYVLKSREQFAKDTNTPVEHNKKYPKLNANSLDELILNYAYKQETPEAIEKEKNQRRCFVHFLKGLLNFDPADRYTPDEARLHPFVRGKPCEFLPSFDAWLRESRERANRQKLALPSAVASPSLSTSSARTASSHGVGTEISDATMTSSSREGTHPNTTSKAEASSASSLYGHSVDSSSGGHSGGSGSGGGRQGTINSARKDHQQQQQQQQLNNDSATAGHSLSLSHPPSLLTLSAMAKGTVPNRGHIPSLPLQAQQQFGRGPSQSGQLPSSLHAGGSAAEGAGATDAQALALANAFGRTFVPPQQQQQQLAHNNGLQLQQQQLAQQQQAQLSPHYQSQHQQFQQQPHLFPSQQQQQQQQQLDSQLGRNLAGYGAGAFGGTNRGAAGVVSGGGLLQLNGGSATGLYEGHAAFQQSPSGFSAGDGGSPYGGSAEADGSLGGFAGGGQPHPQSQLQLQLQQQQQQSAGVLPLLDISPYVTSGGPLAAVPGGSTAPSAFSVHAAKLGRGQTGGQSQHQQQQQQQQQQFAASDLIAKQQQVAAAAAAAALAAQNAMFSSTSQQQLGFNPLGQAILIPQMPNSAVSSPASVHSMQGVHNAYAAIAGPFLSPSQETNTPTNAMSELPIGPSGFHRLSSGSESSAITGPAGIHSTNSNAIPIPSAGRSNNSSNQTINSNHQQQSPYNPQRNRRGGPGSNQPYPAGIVSPGSMPSPTTHLPSSWSHSGMMRNPGPFRHQRQPSGPSAGMFPPPPVLHQQHSQPLPATANPSMFSPQQQQRLFFQYQMQQQQQQQLLQLQQQQQQASSMNSPSSAYSSSSSMYPNTPSYLHPKKLVLVTPSHSHPHAPADPPQLSLQQSPAAPQRHHRQSSASSNSPLSPLSGSALPAPPVLGGRKNSLQASAAPFQPRNSQSLGQSGPQRSPSQNRNQNRPGSRTAIERSTPPSHEDQEVVQMDTTSTARSRAQSTANDPLSGVASPVSPAQTGAGRGIVSPPSGSGDTPAMNGDMLTPPANFHANSTAYRRSSVPKVQPSSRALQSQARMAADIYPSSSGDNSSSYPQQQPPPAHVLPRGMSDDSGDTDGRDLYDVEAASWDPYFAQAHGPSSDSGGRAQPPDTSMAGGGPTDIQASPYPPPQLDQQGQDSSIASSDPSIQPPPGLYEMSSAFHNASMLHVNPQGIPYALQTGHPRQFGQPNMAVDTAFFANGPSMLPGGGILPHPLPSGPYAAAGAGNLQMNQPNFAYAMMQQATQPPPAAYGQGLAPLLMAGQYYPPDPRSFPQSAPESKAAPMQVSPVNVPYRGWNQGLNRAGPPVPTMYHHQPGPPGILYPPPPTFMSGDPGVGAYSTAVDLTGGGETDSRASPPHVRVDGAGGYDDQAGSYDYGGENAAGAGSYHPVHSISGMMSGVMSQYSSGS